MISYLFKDPQWFIALATVFSTLILGSIALFGETYRNWRNKPIIKIGFGNYKPYVIYSYEDPLAMLIRLKIVNQGKTVAKNCRVKIISVTPENENVRDSLIDEPDTLKWSSAPKDMRYYESSQPIHREHLNISPKGGWEFCDLFKIDSREKRVIFISPGERDFLAEKGKGYIATIEIYGDNLKPTKKEIKFSVPDRIDWTNQTNPIMYLAQIDEVRNISQ